MATKTNVKDIGWMYHTPSQPKAKSSIPQVAILSQIPLLNPAEIEDPNLASKQANYIKPTDSDYIALCKMGGRKNLLSMKEQITKSNDPISYPRCDWYYLLDNQMFDNQNKAPDKVYRAQVPDYMVHDVCDVKRKPIQNIHINIDENPSNNPTENRLKTKSSIKNDSLEKNENYLKQFEKSTKKVEEPTDMFKLLAYGYSPKRSPIN